MPHPRGVLVEDRLLNIDGFQPEKHRRLTDDGLHARTGQPGSYWLKAVQDSLMQEECGGASIGGLQLEWRPASTRNGVTDTIRVDVDDMERFRELSLEDLSRMDPGDAERIISDSLDIVWMMSTPWERRVLVPEDVQTYQKYCPERDSTVRVITDVRFRYQRYELRTLPAE